MNALGTVALGTVSTLALLAANGPATTWQTHNQTGTRLQEEARYREAEAEYIVARDLLVAQGNRSAEYATVVNNLATVHARLGRLTEAENAYLEALSLWQTMGGARDQDRARVLANLSSLHHQRGHGALAAQTLAQAIEIQERVGDPMLFNSLTILANIHLSDSNLVAAERALERAGQLAAKNPSKEAAKLASLELARCWLHTAQGRLDEAVQDAKRAEPYVLASGGPTSNHYAVYLLRTGRIHIARGDANEAQRYTLSALKVLEQNNAAASPLAARALVDLAVLRRNARQYQQAANLLERALAIFEKMGGIAGSEFASTLLILSEVYRADNRLEPAEALCRKALAQLEANHGPDSVLLATPLNNLAAIQYKLGRPAEAEKLLAQALALREKTFGTTHPDLADNLYNLGIIALESRRFDVAETYLRRSLVSRQQMLGDRHPALLPALTSYIDVLKLTGRKSEAKSWAQVAGAIEAGRDPAADPGRHTVSLSELKGFRPQQ